MKRAIVYFIIFLFIPGSMCAQSSFNFDDYFVDKTMRLDYFHIGDAKEEWVTVDQIFEQGIWAGSKSNLIDKLDNGRYYAKIYDSSSGELIFSKGFDSYFSEYKTTDKAREPITRQFSFLIPRRISGLLWR
jgi:hypothetical protein